MTVGAGERRRDLVGDTPAEPVGALLAELVEERRQQPAPDPPRHSEVTTQRRRATIESAVDVDLLVGVGSVPAELAARSPATFSMRDSSVPASSPPPIASNAMVAPVSRRARGEVVDERLGARVDHVRGALGPEQVDVFGPADDVDETDTVVDDRCG